MSDVDKKETLDRLQDMGYTICDGSNGLKRVVLPDGNEYHVRIWPKDDCVTVQVTDAKFPNNPIIAWGTSGDTLDDVIGRVMRYVCGIYVEPACGSNNESCIIAYAPGLHKAEQVMGVAGIMPVVQSLRGYAPVRTSKAMYQVEVVATSDGYVVRYGGNGSYIACSKKTLSDALAAIKLSLEDLEDVGVE